MDEKDRLTRPSAPCSMLTFSCSPRRGAHALRVVGLPRQPRFSAAWVRRGSPAEVRARLERSPAVTLVVAPELSSGARRLLDERAINWVDETGAANLRGRGPARPRRPRARATRIQIRVGPPGVRSRSLPPRRPSPLAPNRSRPPGSLNTPAARSREPAGSSPAGTRKAGPRSRDLPEDAARTVSWNTRRRCSNPGQRTSTPAP